MTVPKEGGRFDMSEGIVLLKCGSFGQCSILQDGIMRALFGILVTAIAVIVTSNGATEVHGEEPFAVSVGKLCNALADSDPLVVKHAALALGDIGNESCVPLLRMTLSHDAQSVRSAAAYALEKLSVRRSDHRTASTGSMATISGESLRGVWKGIEERNGYKHEVMFDIRAEECKALWLDPVFTVSGPYEVQSIENESVLFFSGRTLRDAVNSAYVLRIVGDRLIMMQVKVNDKRDAIVKEDGVVRLVLQRDNRE